VASTIGFDFVARTRLVFGPGMLERLGELAREAGFRRTLLVSDPGLAASGHAERARRLLESAGIQVVEFHDFAAEPDSDMVEAGAQVIRAARIDSFVAVGGGSSLDCAKGLNFLLTSGGRMADYRGYGKATAPMLPMIAVPTTAGTGSEAQSYALISDSRTHDKMACGDPGAAFRVAILDPELTVSLPRHVTAATGYDALSHAVESAVTTKAQPALRRFRARGLPTDRRALRAGAGRAGRSRRPRGNAARRAPGRPGHRGLHARGHARLREPALRALRHHPRRGHRAVPASRRRWNARRAGPLYAELLRAAGRDPGPDPAAAVADRLEHLAVHAGLPRGLRAAGVSPEHLPALAAHAAEQWTGRFNPRPFDAVGALQLYEAAY
jgi:alcohol dehydrogenase